MANGILVEPSGGIGVGIQVDGSRRCRSEQHRTGRLDDVISMAGRITAQGPWAKGAKGGKNMLQ